METSVSSLDRFKRANVLVGIPTTGQWHYQFGMSLCSMLAFFMANKMGYREESIRPMAVRGSILPNQRLDIVKAAIKEKSSHIFFVDTDQTFPRWILQMLLKHDKDVVACNIATKQIPAQPTARQFNPNNPYLGDFVYNDPKKGLEQVWRVGTGVMLIKTAVFEKIGLNVFSNPWKEELQKYQGEDWSLAEALEAAGIPIYIDHVSSEAVKHIGDYAYDHDVVGSMRQVEIAHG